MSKSIAPKICFILIENSCILVQGYVSVFLGPRGCSR